MANTTPTEDGVAVNGKPAGIVIKQRVRFGKPCIKGTRVAITDILNLLKLGYRLEDIPQQYPEITVQDAETALRYASRVLGKEEILELEAAEAL